MFKSQKRLKAISRNERIKIAQNFDHTEDERAIIEVGARNYPSIISPYCVKNYLTLNPDFAEYIELNAKQVPLKDDLQLDIYLDSEPTKTEKVNVTNAIRVHFAEKIAAMKAASKRNFITALLLLLFGAALLVVCFISQLNNSNEVFTNLIDILAWVLVWDSFEKLIFERRKDTNEQINNFRIMKARVVFRPYEKQYPAVAVVDDEVIDEPKDESEDWVKEDVSIPLNTKRISRKVEKETKNPPLPKDSNYFDLPNLKPLE